MSLLHILATQCGIFVTTLLLFCSILVQGSKGPLLARNESSASIRLHSTQDLTDFQTFSCCSFSLFYSVIGADSTDNASVNIRVTNHSGNLLEQLGSAQCPLEASVMD
eukprot:2613251-Amphidinium_carterae.5